MSTETIAVVAGQLEAALAMLNECVRACPDGLWDTPIAKYPFWHVAYHTLCFVDCYLSISNEAFARELDGRAREGSELHPLGLAELEEEYPSRRFERPEILAYVELCRGKLRAALAAETRDSLAGPSGFSWLPFSRLELHLYNIRHVQHHTGQLGAALRRNAVAVGGWVKSGWR